MRLVTFLATAAMALASGAAFAAGTIYKCKDANGGTIFSPMPCGKDAKEVDTSAALRTGTAPNVQGVSDRAAVSTIDGDCAGRRRSIDDNANFELERIEKEVRAFRNEMNISANNYAGATRDNGIRDQIAGAESRRADILSNQRRDTAELDKSCAEQRSAELKREADRDAAQSAPKP
jgi:hypothetical protein